MPRRVAQRDTVPRGYTKKGSYHGFEEYELGKNGLTVLYHHDPTTPVVGFMVTYLVGSRHEAVGYTGATHILEHLMFKGSVKFPPRRGQSLLDLLSEKGALVNASTWLDRTNYYEVLPREHAAHVIELEADRMRNALITQRDFDMELPAVRSEYAMRVANDPHEYLDERIWATAFMAHPYHHPTIGWLSDIEGVSIDRLVHFYDTYYWPNNAVVTLVGDMDRREALELIRTHFGVHPRSPHPIPAVYTKEPEQQGRRSVEVIREGSVDLVARAYKVPEALHADTPALLTLAALLGDGTSSRLYRALVEPGHASSIDVRYVPFKDPSLFPLYVTLAPGVAHERVDTIIDKVITELVEGGVQDDEVERVLAIAKTELARARDGHYALLSTLNEAIAAGSWRFFFDLPAALSKVTRDELQRVAATYLVARGETRGRYRSNQSS